MENNLFCIANLSQEELHNEIKGIIKEVLGADNIEDVIRNAFSEAVSSMIAPKRKPLKVESHEDLHKVKKISIPDESLRYIERVGAKVNKLSSISKDAGAPRRIIKSVIESMRNTHGFVIEQAVKDYRYKTGITEDTKVSHLEAISLSHHFNSIFENTIDSLIAKTESQNGKNKLRNDIISAVEPLAKLYNDKTPRLDYTYNMVFEHMNCSWKNLSTRYMNAHHTKTPPTKYEIITDNPNALKKFYTTIKNLIRAERVPRG